MRYDRDEVLTRTDLAQLADRLLAPQHPHTKSWPCPNPNHAQTGRTPPVSIFTGNHGVQRWHCHGCGTGGTAIDLVIETRQARNFREALEWLAHRAHVTPTSVHPPRPSRPVASSPPPAGPDAATRRALTSYANGCVNHLHSPEGLDVRHWLTETRAIPHLLVDHFGLGADPGFWQLPRPRGIPVVSPAAVFPVRRRDGEVIFTLSRVLRPVGHLPRWLNTANSIAPNPRLAILQPPGPPRAGPVIVTEGMLDALSAVTAARPAAALLGTGVIDDHVADRLAKLRRPVLLATDNDTAGRNASDRLSALLSARGVAHDVLAIPERHKDLNDWHAANPNRWPTILTAAIKLTMSRTGTEPRSTGLTGIA